MRYAVLQFCDRRCTFMGVCEYPFNITYHPMEIFQTADHKEADHIP